MQSLDHTSPSRQRASHNLRSELAARYVAGGGWERVRYDTLDHAEAMIAYLARCARRDGDRVLRSIPQIAKGLGKPVSGLTTRQVRDRWEDQITASLEFLRVAGYVELVERDLRRQDGQGIGIVVHLRAGVAQSVRTTAFRSVGGGRRPSCDSFSGRVPPPLREPIRRASDVPPSNPYSNSECCCARGALGTRDRALRQSPVRAALERALEAIGDEGSGAAALQAVPELCSEPIEIVARELWLLTGHRDGRLSARGANRLARATPQLERVGYAGLTGPAAPRAALIDLALGGWQDHWTVRTGSEAPMTVGALAELLRKVAHLAIGGDRNRRDETRNRRSVEWRLRSRSRG